MSASCDASSAQDEQQEVVVYDLEWADRADSQSTMAGVSSGLNRLSQSTMAGSESGDLNVPIEWIVTDDPETLVRNGVAVRVSDNSGRTSSSGHQTGPHQTETR